MHLFDTLLITLITPLNGEPPGGRHPHSRRAMGTVAVKIASRSLRSLHYARATFFQRHATLLVVNNAVCHMYGFDFEVSLIRLEILHSVTKIQS